MNRDIGFSTAPMRGGFDSSFLGAQKPNYSMNMGGALDESNQDEHSIKV